MWGSFNWRLYDQKATGSVAAETMKGSIEKADLSEARGARAWQGLCLRVSSVVTPTFPFPPPLTASSPPPPVLPHYPLNSVLSSHSLSFFLHNLTPRSFSSSLCPFHGATTFVVVSLISNYRSSCFPSADQRSPGEPSMLAACPPRTY